MSDISISMGSYYKYLRPKNKRDQAYIIEAEVQVFNDGEVAVEFPDSIRGKHVFVFGDANEYMIELMMTIDAARRASAKEITVVLPFANFSRQDKKGSHRSSMGAAVVARILQSLGINRVITIDVHSDQIQLAYQIPFEHLSGLHLFEDIVREKILLTPPDNDFVFATPDAGGTVRAKHFAKHFNREYVVIDKSRTVPGQIDSMILLGDVKGKTVMLVDDIVDTGGTLIKAVELLYKNGAQHVWVLITHPVLSKDAVDRLHKAGINLITSNTRNKVAGKKQPDNFTVIDCGEILMQAILNVADNKSILKTLA